MPPRSEFVVVARLLAETSQMQAQMRDALGKVEKRSKSTTRRIARAAGRAFLNVGKLGAAGFAGAAVAGARSAIDLKKTLGDIEIQSGASAAEMGDLADAIKDTSKATAISQGDLALTSKRLVDLLGPAGRSAELMDLLGRTAVASGADTAELAGLISAVSDSMGIAADDTVRMESALSAFLAAGKLGKVPLEEMAIVLQDISSTFKDVSSGGPEAAADLAAALQVARKSFGSAAKAGTGLEAFIGSLIKKSAALKKVGVDVFTGEGPEKRLLPFRDILDQIQERGLNVKQLTDALGRKEAAKFAKILTSDEGRREFERISTAARDATDVADDFGKRTESSVFRINKALNDARNAMMSLFTEENIRVFADAVGIVGQAVETLVNDLKAAGDILGKTAGFVAEKVLGREGDIDRSVTTGVVGQMNAIRDKLELEGLEEKAATRAEAVSAGALVGGVLDPEQLEAARERQAERKELRDAGRGPGFRDADAEKAAARERVSAAGFAPTATAQRVEGAAEAAEARDKAIIAAADLQGVTVGQGSEEFQAMRALQQEQVNATTAQTAALLQALNRLTLAAGEQVGAPRPRARPGGGRGGGRSAPLETGTR